MKKEILYRVESVRWRDTTTLTYSTHKIVKRTKKGAWIRDTIGEKRFILNEGRKRFAYETKELAMESFKARKQAQIRILTAQLNCAKQDLAETGEEIKPRKYSRGFFDA